MDKWIGDNELDNTREIAWVYHHSNFRLHCSFERRNNVFNDRSKSSKIVDFGVNLRHAYNFLLVINYSNLGPFYLALFQRYRRFYVEMATPPLFHQNLGVVPLGVHKNVPLLFLQL